MPRFDDEREFKVDRRDIDFTDFCKVHGRWTDVYGHCLRCLEEERAKVNKVVAWADVEYEKQVERMNNPAGWPGKAMNEEEYLEYLSREQQKLEEGSE